MEPLILSNAGIVRDILKRIKNSKAGCRLDDFEIWFPDYFTPSGGGRGVHPPDDLRQLVSWGLVAAYDGGNEVGVDEIRDEIKDYTGEIIEPGNIRRLTFRLTEFARTLENVLAVSLTASPFFGPPQYDNTRKWDDIFMLMPFKAELREVFFNHVQQVAEELGQTAGRADNQSYSSNGAIINDIWSGIFNAKVIVADCTGHNPNVFYEIGIAHTLGKETILICRQESSFPFDVNYLRIILYQDTPEGMKELEASLKIRIEQALLKQGFRVSKR